MNSVSGKLFDDSEGPGAIFAGAFTANIDGAARGNPGPAAYGIIIRRPDGAMYESLGKYIGRTTNNVAEYYALIAALDYAAAKGIRKLRVLSDSQLIVNQIKGLYKVKHPDLRPLHERAKKQAATLEAFSIQYVPREENRDADEMANAALDSTGGKASSPPRAPSAPMPPAAAIKTAPAKAVQTPAGPVKPAEKLLYLEDLRPGQRFSAGTYQMTAERIKSFASEFDPQPFHLDEAAGDRSVFQGLAASGWHTAAATMRMLVAALPFAGGLVGLGGEIAWARPTHPGDTLRVEIEVLEIIPSRSKPDRGIVRTRCTTLNQKGEEVQVLTTKILAYRRAAQV